MANLDVEPVLQTLTVPVNRRDAPADTGYTDEGEYAYADEGEYAEAKIGGHHHHHGAGLPLATAVALALVIALTILIIVLLVRRSRGCSGGGSNGGEGYRAGPGCPGGACPKEGFLTSYSAA